MPLTDEEIEQQDLVDEFVKEVVFSVRPEWVDDKRFITGMRDALVAVIAKKLEVDEREIYPVVE